MSVDRTRESRLLRVLVVATGLCYVIGYPIAIVGHSGFGWLLVFLGGVLLVVVLAFVIRRVQR